MIYLLKKVGCPKMKKILFNILFFIIGALTLASPISAGTTNKEPDFHFLPKLKPLQYDSRMLDAAEIATYSASKYSHRRCWRAVKNALIEANLVDYRPTTRYAKEAGEELEEKFNFKKLDLTDPFEAPVGSILVYSGAGAGHVEIRTPDGFVSDFFSEHPSNLPLVGIYIKSKSA